jgi:TolB protein
MTTGNDPLRAALHGLADAVEDTDLYGPAMRRSRRIAHQRAAAGTVSALAALGLACGGLWYLAPPGGHRGSDATVAISAPVEAPIPELSTPATTAPAPRPSATVHTPPRRQPHPVRMGTATPRSRSLADLPGQVFYDQQGDRPQVVRLSGAGNTQTVLDAPHAALGISTDGSRIAYIQDGALLIADTDGGAPERPYAGTVSDDQAPAWSPDGSRLLIGTDDPVVLDLADGTVEALPGGLTGRHFRWSGDGSKLVYATSSCQLKVAGTAADTPAVTDPAVTVPVLGDPDQADNPSGLGACRPVSVDATGSRVAVPLRQVDGTATSSTNADSGMVANAVVDTATGGADPLPVSGVVNGAVFDSAGNLLVRAFDGGRTVLSLFSPAGHLLVQAQEPSRLRRLNLVAYTN